jgi:hypothetical protein
VNLSKRGNLYINTRGFQARCYLGLINLNAVGVNLEPCYIKRIDVIAANKYPYKLYINLMMIRFLWVLLHLNCKCPMYNSSRLENVIKRGLPK